MQRTSRRRFLAGIATASAALAAGCSSGSSDSSGGSGANSSTSSAETTSGGTDEPSNSEATTGGSPDDSTASTDATTSGGNTSSGGGETTTVAAGPDARLVFEPEGVEVSVGDTVVWEFESGGHNVSAVPEDSEEVSIPGGATPFASYESGDRYSVVEEGGTYEHTFETPGEYTYVCIPHVASGMVGTVTVTE